jgi:hypothetical protein
MTTDAEKLSFNIMRMIYPRTDASPRDYPHSAIIKTIEQALTASHQAGVREERERCAPSPEARVDWEKEAKEIAQVAEFKKKPTIEELETILNSPEGRNVVILPDGSVSNSDYETNLVKRIAKALSAAFEKGREGR